MMGRSLYETPSREGDEPRPSISDEAPNERGDGAVPNRVEGVGVGFPAVAGGSEPRPDKGPADPLHVQPLVWLAAEVCGITPLDVLTIQAKPGPRARTLVAYWLHDFEGWSWRRIAEVLGRTEATLSTNYGNYRRKLRGPNGLNEIHATFMRRAAAIRMEPEAQGRGSFLQTVDPPPGPKEEGGHGG